MLSQLFAFFKAGCCKCYSLLSGRLSVCAVWLLSTCPAAPKATVSWSPATQNLLQCLPTSILVLKLVHLQFSHLWVPFSGLCYSYSTFVSQLKFISSDMSSLTRPINKYLLITYFTAAGLILDNGTIAVSETDKHPCNYGVYSQLGGQTHNKVRNKLMFC